MKSGLGTNVIFALTAAASLAIGAALWRTGPQFLTDGNTVPRGKRGKFKQSQRKQQRGKK